MQKLDYTEKISIILLALKTHFFIEFYDQYLDTPTTPGDFTMLIPALFDTKSQYEILKGDKEIDTILNVLGADEIYSSGNLTWLTTVFSSNQISLTNIVSNKQAITFFIFHKTLASIENINDMVFYFPEETSDDLDSGRIVLRILENNDNVTVVRLSKILKLIEDLLDALSKIYNVTNQPKIYLLDSGSDTNLGLETNVKIVKSLYLIFKEVWDAVFNRKYYKLKKDNDALMENLTIRAELKKKAGEGVITEEEEKQYVYLLKNRVEALIGLNVITKEIYDDQPHKSVIKLTLAAFNAKLLNETNKTDNDEVN